MPNWKEAFKDLEESAEALGDAINVLSTDDKLGEAASDIIVAYNKLKAAVEALRSAD